MAYRKAPGYWNHKSSNRRFGSFRGLDAFVGRLTDKSKYFSFPFNSLILTIIGNMPLNAVAVALS